MTDPTTLLVESLVEASPMLALGVWAAIRGMAWLRKGIADHREWANGLTAAVVGMREELGKLREELRGIRPQPGSGVPAEVHYDLTPVEEPRVDSA